MASSVSMKWYGDSVTREIREDLKVRLVAAGDYLVAQVQANIAEPGPPHSAPGDFPHKVSGELSESVSAKFDRRSMSVTVTASAEHAPFVEDSRPFLRRTLRESRSAIRGIMLGRGVSRGRFKFKG